MEFKPRKEIEAIDQFIKGDINKVDNGLSFSELKRLDVDALADQLEAINNQSVLMTWVICAHIRDNFASDKAYGQYINQLRERNPYHPLCVVTPSARNRYIHAGRLAMKLKIVDIGTLGMAPTAFYDLAFPKNLDIADQLFHQIRKEKKNLQVDDVRRLIAQARAVPEDIKPELEKMDYDKHRNGLRLVPVINNVAKDIDQQDEQEEDLEEVAEDIEGAVIRHEVVASVKLAEPTTQTAGYHAVFSQAAAKEVPEICYDWKKHDRRKNTAYNGTVKLSAIESDDLLLELASRVESKSNDEVKSDMMLLAERYDKSFNELAVIFDSCKKTALSMCS